MNTVGNQPDSPRRLAARVADRALDTEQMRRVAIGDASVVRAFSGFGQVRSAGVQMLDPRLSRESNK